jgi:3-oxoacyl-[acyl-carrier-protein] synthase-3
MATSILGTGACVGRRCVTNEELVGRGLDTSDAWIVEHTGIKERRVALEAEATSDYAVTAGRLAMQDAGVDGASIDLVICATSTPDHPLPATASLVQAGLGLRCGGFDVNGVCSGFVYALITGFALHQAGGYRNILVIGADTYSKVVDPLDRQTTIFFGDGAGAVVLGSTGDASLLSSEVGCDGSRAAEIIVKAGGSRFPITLARLMEREHYFRMNGRAVREFVTRRLPELIESVARKAAVPIDDVRLVIPHQANKTLLLECARRIGLTEQQLYVNVHRLGNCAAASIPIALDEAVHGGVIQRGDHVILAGFGGGLSWAALCLRWTTVVRPGR